MYVLKMEADKSLVITVNGFLYEGETEADDIVVLMPPSYEGTQIAGSEVVVRCVLPDGGKYTRTLELDNEDYKGYLKYNMKVTNVLTVQDGAIEMWLTVYADGVKILKTSSAVLHVRHNWNGDDGEFTETAIDDIYLRINQLEDEQVDDLVYDEETRQLQLVAGTEEVGEGVQVPGEHYTVNVVKLDGGGAG